jgi:hypothetical protein
MTTHSREGKRRQSAAHFPKLTQNVGACHGSPASWFNKHAFLGSLVPAVNPLAPYVPVPVDLSSVTGGSTGFGTVWFDINLKAPIGVVIPLGCV